MVKVDTDTTTVSITPAVVGIEVPAQLDDIGGTADAAGAVADVVNKVVQLVQGLVDDDIKVRLLSLFPFVSFLLIIPLTKIHKTRDVNASPKKLPPQSPSNSPAKTS